MGIMQELYAETQSCPGYAVRVVELIEEQQKKLGRCPAWGVGEQLKKMCRKDRRIAALVEKDLESPGMGIAEAEKNIRAFAMRHGGFATEEEGEQILRKFYGLGEAEKAEPATAAPEVLSLTDFL